MHARFIKELRQRLSMTQDQFSETYHIPLPALRNWEQSRRVPDPAAQAYLATIDAMPEKVAQCVTVYMAKS